MPNVCLPGGRDGRAELGGDEKVQVALLQRFPYHPEACASVHDPPCMAWPLPSLVDPCLRSRARSLQPSAHDVALFINCKLFVTLLCDATSTLLIFLYHTS